MREGEKQVKDEDFIDDELEEDEEDVESLHLCPQCNEYVDYLEKDGLCETC